MNKLSQFGVHAIILLAFAAATGLPDAPPGIQLFNGAIHPYWLFVPSTLAALHGYTPAVVLIFVAGILWEYPDLHAATHDAITVTIGLIAGHIARRAVRDLTKERHEPGRSDT